MTSEGRLRIGVVIATLGRPQDAAQVLDRLRAQSAAPARIVFSVEKMEDLPPGRVPGQLDPDVDVVLGPRGLCAQRNRGMARVLHDCDVVVFYDDDFLPGRRSLERLGQLFDARPDVVGATGIVLADGVTRGGLSWEEAQRIVDEHDARSEPPPQILADLGWAYGCNMAYRCRAARGLRFDERLPLYGWQEDVDFAGQIARRGRVVHTDAFTGVHLGVTRSRSPGLRLGFSQMVNPVYLVRKGTMRVGHAARIMGRNLIANHVRALAPEPYIDRRGRLAGNWRGLLHLATGRVDPERIWSLP
jgi:GT2 family glycosyltransferase